MTGKTATTERPQRHRCAAVACRELVILRRLFCDQHWSMVPRYLQDELRATFRWGQETGKVKPSTAWADAADRAICAVADHETAA